MSPWTPPDSRSCSMFEVKEMLLVDLPGCPASVVLYLGRPCFLTTGHTVGSEKLVKSSMKAQWRKQLRFQKWTRELNTGACSHVLHLCPPACGRRQSGLKEDNVLKPCCTAWPVWTVVVVRCCCSVETLMILLMEGRFDGVWWGDWLKIKIKSIRSAAFIHFDRNVNTFFPQMHPQVQAENNKAFLILNLIWGL